MIFLKNSYKVVAKMLGGNGKVKVLQIYEKYYLPENLQMHMLRVAACSWLIIDHWNGPQIDKNAIIRVLLLHDMGNMLKIPEDFWKNENF